jgi:hypothetical protein
MAATPLEIIIKRQEINAQLERTILGYRQVILSLLKDAGAPIDGGFMLEIRAGVRWELEVDPETNDLHFTFMLEAN